jgi:hypothetical protein
MDDGFRDGNTVGICTNAFKTSSIEIFERIVLEKFGLKLTNSTKSTDNIGKEILFISFLYYFLYYKGAIIRFTTDSFLKIKSFLLIEKSMEYKIGGKKQHYEENEFKLENLIKIYPESFTHSNGQIECRCNMKFNNRSDHEKHRATHYPKMSIKCYCNENLIQEKVDVGRPFKLTEVINHINKYHVLNYCFLCNKFYATKSYLKMHLKNLHDFEFEVNIRKINNDN